MPRREIPLRPGAEFEGLCRCTKFGEGNGASAGRNYRQNDLPCGLSCRTRDLANLQMNGGRRFVLLLPHVQAAKLTSDASYW
jgi:hypothetical protein